jgi:hypothetical protein
VAAHSGPGWCDMPPAALAEQRPLAALTLAVRLGKVGQIFFKKEFTKIRLQTCLGGRSDRKGPLRNPLIRLCWSYQVALVPTLSFCRNQSNLLNHNLRLKNLNCAFSITEPCAIKKQRLATYADTTSNALPILITTVQSQPYSNHNRSPPDQWVSRVQVRDTPKKPTKFLYNKRYRSIG